MEEEFYAVIKLISGEEIFSKVCACDEGDRILLILEDPIKIEKIKQTELPIVRVNSWVEMSEESTFIIDIKNVLMISETTDDELIDVHKRFVKTKNKKSGRSNITPKMGYVNTISNARKKLEELYDSN